MLKARNLVVLALVGTFGQAAWGQGEVRSYFTQGTGNYDLSVIAPPEGFVVTDILAATGAGGWFLDVADGGPRLFGSNSALQEFHFSTGIAVPGNAQLRLVHDTFAGTSWISISGYVPGPQPSVPAVGTWGLCVMVLMIVAGGTMVLRQRRPVA